MCNCVTTEVGDQYATGRPSVRVDTSEAAAASVNAEPLRLQVLRFIREQGLKGATDKEIEQHFPRHIHESISPRRRELVLKGLIIPSGEKRRTPSGRWARVHVCKCQEIWT